MTPLPVVSMWAPAQGFRGQLLQGTVIVYSRHLTTQLRAFGQLGGGPQAMTGWAYRRGMT
jgi:hypothetical protein